MIHGPGTGEHKWVSILAEPGVAWLPGHARKRGKPWGTELGLGRPVPPETGAGVVVHAAPRVAGVGLRTESRAGRATTLLTVYLV